MNEAVWIWVMSILAGLLLFALTACGVPAPPSPSGPWHQLNAGKWTFNENALRGVPK